MSATRRSAAFRCAGWRWCDLAIVAGSGIAPGAGERAQCTARVARDSAWCFVKDSARWEVRDSAMRRAARWKSHGAGGVRQRMAHNGAGGQ
eukprot:474591-Pleurochrysis_carterae.AAC.1